MGVRALGSLKNRENSATEALITAMIRVSTSNDEMIFYVTDLCSVAVDLVLVSGGQVQSLCFGLAGTQKSSYRTQTEIWRPSAAIKNLL